MSNISTIFYGEDPRLTAECFRMVLFRYGYDPDYFESHIQKLQLSLQNNGPSLYESHRQSNPSLTFRHQPTLRTTRVTFQPFGTRG